MLDLSTVCAPGIFLEKKVESRIDTDRVATLILSGGQGTRLFPLTSSKCKPAICYGGRYRLIDIPVSNALNCGLSKIFILAQYLTTSLHQHLLKTYRCGSVSGHFIEVLCPETKPDRQVWFQGTADAVRQNMGYLAEQPVDYYLILSGDQLYRMDLKEMIRMAQLTDADAVVACLPIGVENAKRMGVLKTDACGFIRHFHEKPQKSEELERMRLSALELARLKPTSSGREYLGSMGIYLFKRQVLLDLLAKDMREDFGKHLIPEMVLKGNTAAYIHEGYWEDIGTVESFYRANMDLTQSNSSFDLYHEKWPIFSYHQNLPGPRLCKTSVNNSILCEGAQIEADEISRCIIGPRSLIQEGTIIRDSYVMGHDYFSPPLEHARFAKTFQIGKNCIIQKAIVDKHVQIGSGVQLINKNQLSCYDGDNIYIRDGIIIVPEGATIPDGYVL
jgi:glucose-1-phosphate adenylyltransferase